MVSEVRVERDQEILKNIVCSIIYPARDLNSMPLRFGKFVFKNAIYQKECRADFSYTTVELNKNAFSSLSQLGNVLSMFLTL